MVQDTIRGRPYSPGDRTKVDDRRNLGTSRNFNTRACSVQATTGITTNDHAFVPERVFGPFKQDPGPAIADHRIRVRAAICKAARRWLREAVASAGAERRSKSDPVCTVSAICASLTPKATQTSGCSVTRAAGCGRAAVAPIAALSVDGRPLPGVTAITAVTAADIPG